MSTILIISNRLPVTVKKTDKGLEFIESIGGLTTGLKTYHERSGSLWIGWPGILEEELTAEEKEEAREILRERYKCVPIFMTQEEVDSFYYGFCNNTIWPLFHYFNTIAEYNQTTWEAYRRMNRRFCETVKDFIREENIVWIHDYQLLLLPEMLKEDYPDLAVGLFLHIPFPSYELFRQIPWREEILRGMLNADLVGFHTYDYVRHFMRSAQRILGLENSMNSVFYENEEVKVGAFPMGIDYERFAMTKTGDDAINKTGGFTRIPGARNILSVDRLDYSKGIIERLEAYRYFLEKYPRYRNKVYLNLIVAPSREGIQGYDELHGRIENLVSRINSTYGSFNWMPIYYLFQTFPQDEIVKYYHLSDVMLVTSLRDGMNLVAKEYIASRQDYDGMVIISETAGAASELVEAISVNPYDVPEIAEGIREALEMPADEKEIRNKALHRRLIRYDIKFWARDFLDSLNEAYIKNRSVHDTQNIENRLPQIMEAYKKANRRIICLDYDGTLVGFWPLPEQAKPDRELLKLLSRLTADKRNLVAIVTGRDRNNLEDWFGKVKNLCFVASHGLWIKKPGGEWYKTVEVASGWKEEIRPMLEMYSDRMPGSIIEEKEESLSFHYRMCNADMVASQLSELKMALSTAIGSSYLALQEGKKVLEIKDIRVSKANASMIFDGAEKADFIFGAGDDVTDENFFKAMPKEVITVKVGAGETAARYRLKGWQDMRRLLKAMADA